MILTCPFCADLLNFNAFAFCRYKHWGWASPWLMGTNPRDIIMPIDGDDGFFPTTGNELVGLSLAIGLLACGNLINYHLLTLIAVQKPEVVNSSRKYRIRVLVCAPSNSALDEIVFRLLKTGMTFLTFIYFSREKSQYKS